jgi:hypothetical protein
MQVDGQPCNVTKRTSISQTSGERIQIAALAQWPELLNVEVSVERILERRHSRCRTRPGKGKATPMLATVEGG